MSYYARQKIDIVTYLLPSSNPRVPKEAEALARAGFEVSIVSSALPGASRIPKSDSDAIALRKLNQVVPWWGLWRHRLIKKSAPGWPQHMRAQVAAYGSLFVDLVRFLQKSPRDVPRIMHLEPSFLAAAQAGGFRSIFCDFEDWYSRDLLQGSRSAELTSALQAAEQAVLRQSLACWCTSQAMASALSEAYGGNESLVVRNVFPQRLRKGIDGQWKDRPAMAKLSARNIPSQTRPADAPVSFHWFSQTIGPGRGLEFIFRAMDGLPGDWELHLRGDLGNYRAWFEETCPVSLRQRTIVHGLVGTEELSSRIAEHDVGLACELRSPFSRDLTITNKMFQYLQAGLAVLASDTKGQKEAAGLAPGAISLFKTADADAARAVLQKVMLSKDQLRAMRAVAWEAGSRLCWENESPKLVEAVRFATERQTLPSR